MNKKKYTQLELPFSFKNDLIPDNVISFPQEIVLDKIRKERVSRRQDAINKGVEKCVKSLKWY